MFLLHLFTRKYQPVSFVGRGFSLIEIVITLAVMAIISAISLSALSSSTDNEVLNKATDSVVSVFAESRSLTISAKNASNFGVHLTSTGPIIFKGNSYNASATSNIPLLLNSRVSINTISLVDGSTDVVFDRFTGNTSNNGTFRVVLVSNPSKYKTVTVYKTGIVEVQ